MLLSQPWCQREEISPSLCASSTVEGIGQLGFLEGEGGQMGQGTQCIHTCGTMAVATTKFKCKIYTNGKSSKCKVVTYKLHETKAHTVDYACRTCINISTSSYI